MIPSDKIFHKVPDKLQIENAERIISQVKDNGEGRYMCIVEQTDDQGNNDDAFFAFDAWLDQDEVWMVVVDKGKISEQSNNFLDMINDGRRLIKISN